MRIHIQGGNPVTKSNRLILATLVGVLFPGIAMAADPVVSEPTELTEEVLEPEAAGHDLESIGKQTNNPVGAAWMLWT